MGKTLMEQKYIETLHEGKGHNVLYIDYCWKAPLHTYVGKRLTHEQVLVTCALLCNKRLCYKTCSSLFYMSRMPRKSFLLFRVMLLPSALGLKYSSGCDGSTKPCFI